MNNIRIYAFFWMIVLLTVSCYEDKGNYDYHPINEVKISGIKEDPYEILRWDTLKIPVTLENSLNEKAELIYAWYLDQKKIAETEDLCYVVSDKAKKYQARMEVTLPEDDSVRFFADFEVQVFSPYSKGLLLLSDYEDYPEVSFMSTLNNPTNKIMRDVYSLENKRELKGKALAIEQSDEYSYGGTVFVHTSASSHELDPVLFKEIALFDENSFTGPAQEYDMVYCRFEDAITEFGGAIGKDGIIYPKQARQNRYMASSLKPIHVEGDAERLVDYRLSPMLLNTRNSTLGYDNLSGRFMYFMNSYDIPSYDENQYDEVRISQTYIGLPWLGWGKNMSGGTYQFSSLFYDPVTDRAALARAHTATGKLKGQDSLVFLSGHHLAEGSVMAVNSGINWLYYSDGGRQLYVLNLSDPDFKFPSIPFECALPDNCRITMLKVSVDNLALFVGVETDRPEKYKGDVYKINAKDGTILEHYQRFGGTPVDMVEKKSVEYDVEE